LIQEVKMYHGSEKPVFFYKNPTHWVLGGFVGIWALLSFSDFLFE